MVVEAVMLFIPMTVDQSLRNLMQFIKRSLRILIKYFDVSLILCGFLDVYFISLVLYPSFFIQD
jgi:hypothetical protein